MFALFLLKESNIAETSEYYLNIEQGISNDEVWNRYAPSVAYGYAPASYLFKY